MFFLINIYSLNKTLKKPWCLNVKYPDQTQIFLVNDAMLCWHQNVVCIAVTTAQVLHNQVSLKEEKEDDLFAALRIIVKMAISLVVYNLFPV